MSDEAGRQACFLVGKLAGPVCRGWEGGYVLGVGYQVTQAETVGSERRFTAASIFSANFSLFLQPVPANFAAGASGSGRCSSGDSCY